MDDRSTDKILEKVKAVLLSMQRCSWEQGIAAQAFLECGDTDTGILLAREAVHRQSNDGRLACLYPNESVDPAINGGPVLEAYRLVGEESFQQAAQRMAEYLLYKAPRNPAGILFHSNDSPKTLIDGIYHLAPFLALAGFPQEAVFQIDGFRKIHFDPQRKLYLHYWDDAKKVFERNLFWGGGQGWMAGALVGVLAALPVSMREEQVRLTAYLKELIDACLNYQRPDGLFHDVLDDPSTFVETTAGLMLSYAIYMAISGHWLEMRYQEFADRMRLAGLAKVDAVGTVQGAAGAPDFNHVGQSAEAQAFLILTEAAFRKLNQIQR